MSALQFLALLLFCWYRRISSWSAHVLFPQLGRPGRSCSIALQGDLGRPFRPQPLLAAARRRKSIKKQPVANTSSKSSRSVDVKGSTTEKSIYSMPALYDLAFGYRDYQDEVDFLLHQHELCTGRQSSTIRILELAAGPARHALTALASTTKVQSAIAIDLSTEMASYARELAVELLPDNPTALDYRVQDMRTFSLEKEKDEQVDTAWILLGSLQHLTDNQGVIQCFQSVRRALRDDGTVVIELPHPRETFSMVECTRNGWKIPLEDEDGQKSGELTIIWGDDDDEFDPIRQVRQFTIAMELQGVPSTEEMQNVREIVPMRLFTAQEIDALAQCAGMKVVQMYGALEEGVAVDDDELAFRLVCVLQKR